MQAGDVYVHKISTLNVLITHILADIVFYIPINVIPKDTYLNHNYKLSWPKLKFIKYYDFNRELTKEQIIKNIIE